MKKRFPACAALLTISSQLAVCAANFDWPQWQGPDRKAVSKETGLLQEWPQDGPRLAWKISGLGGGYGGPSIAAGQIFGMSNRGDDEVVWALSEKDGGEIWVTRLGPTLNEGMPQGKEGAGCTPTVDGARLYVIGRGSALACLQVADGKIVWQRNLVTDFGGSIPTWTYNESPLVDGDKLICTPGGEDATLVALNKLGRDGIQVRFAVPLGPPQARTGYRDAAAAGHKLDRPFVLEMMRAANAAKAQGQAI